MFFLGFIFKQPKTNILGTFWEAKLDWESVYMIKQTAELVFLVKHLLPFIFIN